MKKLVLALMVLSSPVWAQNRPQNLAAVTPENIPLSAGAVGNIFVTPSTVTSVTVPYWADTFIMSGDPMWVCENPSRCGETFPTVSRTVTGWIYNPSGRMLKGNLQVSTSYVNVYVRPDDRISTTTGANNIGAFEWSCRTCPQ
jgi:hypothetical protein